MPELTKDDILITVADSIRKTAARSQSDDFVFYIQPVESNNNLPKGSVLENLEEAAADASCSVISIDTVRVNLRKTGPLPYV